MHKNARLTPKGREVLIRRLASGQPVGEVAQALGISATTARKWGKRHQAGEGLQDHSSRPRSSPRQLRPEQRSQVEALRRQRRTGRWIAQQTGLSPATVSRVLRRAGISRWREWVPQPPVHRYEHAAPGELIHLDIKKLGRIGSPGHRVTGNAGIGTAASAGSLCMSPSTTTRDWLRRPWPMTSEGKRRWPSCTRS